MCNVYHFAQMVTLVHRCVPAWYLLWTNVHKINVRPPLVKPPIRLLVQLVQVDLCWRDFTLNSTRKLSMARFMPEFFSFINQYCCGFQVSEANFPSIMFELICSQLVEEEQSAPKVSCALHSLSTWFQFKSQSQSQHHQHLSLSVSKEHLQTGVTKQCSPDQGGSGTTF